MLLRSYCLLILVTFISASAIAMENNTDNQGSSPPSTPVIAMGNKDTKNNNFLGSATTTTEVVAFPKTSNLNLNDKYLTVASNFTLEKDSRYSTKVLEALRQTKVNHVITKHESEGSTTSKKEAVLKLEQLEDIIRRKAVEIATPKIREDQKRQTLANLPFYRRHAVKCYLLTLLVAAGVSGPFWLPELLKKLNEN